MATPDQQLTTRSIVLAEHETTGLLPVGFEFERGGTRYDRFGISTDGFIMFGRGGRQGGVHSLVPLATWDRARLGGGVVTYEVRGIAPRRRLTVLLAARGVSGAALEIAVHERTGIVEVYGTGQSLGDPTIRQLDIVQSSSPSRVNSARKIG
jgi:hypothetical protein